MLNTILTYILAIAMSLGAAGVPAVPETANQMAIENVVLRVDDETFALDTRAVLSAAAGTEESLLGFYLENKGTKLFPLAAKITAESAMFSISEVGSAFRITDEALMEMIGLTTEDLPEVYDSSELQQKAENMGSTTIGEYLANGDAMWDFFRSYEGAEVSEGSIYYEGAEYPCTTVYAQDGIPALWALLDGMRLGDHGELSAYLDEILTYYNEEMGMQGESFAEAFGQISELPPAALELSRADVDGEALTRLALSFEEDGTTMEMASTTCRNLESIEMNMTAEEDNYSESVQLKIDTLNRLTEGDMSVDAKITITNDNEYIADEHLVGIMEIDFALDENGNETACTAQFTRSSWMHYGEEVIDFTNSDSISFDALVTKAENSIHVNANLDVNLEETAFDAGIDFDINFSTAPYADPFAGKKTVDFSTPEELIESGQFKADGMSFGMDAMRIAFTQDAAKIMGAAELLVAPKAVSDEEYAQAAEVFGGPLPKFKLPDGWVLKDVDVVEGTAKLRFTSEDGEEEFQVSASRNEYARKRIEQMSDAGEEIDFTGDMGYGTTVHGDTMLDFWFLYTDEDFVREIIDNIE